MRLHNQSSPPQEQETHFENYQLQRSLLDQRKIFLWGAVDDNSAKKVVEQLCYLSAVNGEQPIHFHINSPGGIVTSGHAILDMMQTISTPVYTYCIGFAASAASILLSAGEKDNRYIYPTAEVMIHQPSMSGLHANYKDIEIHTKHILKTKELTAKILAKNCDKSVNRIMKDFDRDYWMDANEAIEYGIVDKIVTY